VTVLLGGVMVLEPPCSFGGFKLLGANHSRPSGAALTTARVLRVRREAEPQKGDG